MADIKNDSSVAAQQAQALHTPAITLSSPPGVVMDGASTVMGSPVAGQALQRMNQASRRVGQAVQKVVTNIGVIDQNFVAADQAGGR